MLSKSNIRELWHLFWSVLKIGVFTFGGGDAMIPLIEREMIDRRGWIARDDFTDLLTLAQTAPGPIALNTSVFVGYKMKGYAGAVCALLGVVVPSFTILLIIAIYFSNIRDNRWVDAAFKGMRPAVVALIVAPIINLSKGLGWGRYIVAAVVALLIWYVELSPIWLIILGIVVGIGWSAWSAKRGGSK